MKKNSTISMLFFPDPLWVPHMISGTAFLYFTDKILFTIPSASSIGILGVGPHKLSDLVQRRKPQWGESFQKMFQLYVTGTKASSATMNLLKPLHGSCLEWIQLVFPHTTDLMDEAEDLQKSAGYDVESILKMIDPLTAGDALAKHVLFEMYIQTVHSEKDDKEVFELGKQYARRLVSGDPIPPEYDADPAPLYDYCDELFSKEDLNALLCKAYMLRLVALREVKEPDILFLSNPKILPFLCNMPVSTKGDQANMYKANEDIVSWEIFRQILSPVLDPLDERRVELIAEYREKRLEEITRLRNKCLRLAYTLRSIPSIETLESEISKLIEREIRHEISDLLKLDQQSLDDFLTSVFSDEKTWLAISAFIGALFSGQDMIKAGAAIAALSNIGAKAFKAASDRRKKLRTSDYTLIYNIRQAMTN